MKNPFKKISIVTSLLWAAGIIAAAIVKAPEFFTIILMPLLAVSFLTAIETISRRSNTPSGVCL